MYYISKHMTISAAHRIETGSLKMREGLHGHNWDITVYCKSEVLDEDGIVYDFREIKSKIRGYLDHSDLNAVLPFNPTSENLAKWIADQIPQCYKVRVAETDNNVAVYTVPGRASADDAL